MIKKSLFCCCILFLLVAPIQAQRSSRGMTDVQRYLLRALEIIEDEALNQDRIADWDSYIDSAIENVADSEDFADAHDILRETVALLEDNHSTFLSAEEVEAIYGSGSSRGLGVALNRDTGVIHMVFEGSAAESAQIEQGDRIIAINGNTELDYALLQEASAELTIERNGQEITLTVYPDEYNANVLSSGHAITGQIAYIEAHSIRANNDNPFQDEAVIAALDIFNTHVDSCAWVVDLRRNSGGNFSPMLAMIAPLLEQDTIPGGYFYGEDEAIQNWSYHDGAIYFDDDSLYTLPDDTDVPDLKHKPVAVLLSEQTASSAEMMIVALFHRDNVRTFGEASAGLATRNRWFTLSDNSVLNLTVGVTVDIAGNQYWHGITPDEIVTTDWRNYGTPDDPVLQSAITWLQQEPECQTNQ